MYTILWYYSKLYVVITIILISVANKYVASINILSFKTFIINLFIFILIFIFTINFLIKYIPLGISVSLFGGKYKT